MADTGWPLIPRELLPAPVPVVSTRARRVSGPATPGGRQLPIFGAGTTESSPLDLAGLLAGPGQLHRMGGTARVSVEVDEAWRVHVLAAELVSRGLVVHWKPVEPDRVEEVKELVSVPVDVEEPEEVAPPPAAPEVADEAAEEVPPTFEVRTAYSSRLIALARAWPTEDLFLSGPRLRLWVAAAGRPEPGGFTLDLSAGAEPERLVAALRRAGLTGSLSDDRRRFRITRRRVLGRLAELVGERPASAPVEAWPGGAGA